MNSFHKTLKLHSSYIINESKVKYEHLSPSLVWTQKSTTLQIQFWVNTRQQVFILSICSYMVSISISWKTNPAMLKCPTVQCNGGYDGWCLAYIFHIRPANVSKLWWQKRLISPDVYLIARNQPFVPPLYLINELLSFCRKIEKFLGFYFFCYFSVLQLYWTENMFLAIRYYLVNKTRTTM